MTDRWQPIETAPRDGTWALFWQPANKQAGHPSARKTAVSVDQFSDEWPRARHQLPEAKYTHWMPLPPAPTDTGREA
jgi:hypothetical protein